MAGVPEPLLLLHGFTQTGRGWDEVVRHLDGERYRALAPDIRGHGAAATRRPIDFDACVQDAVGLMRGRFALAGYSQGARLALHVALAHPERVTRVVLVGAMPTPEGVSVLPQDVRRAMRIARIAPRLVARRLERWGREPPLPTGDDATDAAYALGRNESFRHGGLWLARELAYLGRPWQIDLADVAAPVRLWYGDRDFVCPPSIGEEYVRLLPHAELNVVSGTHQLLFSHWRELLLDVSRPI